MHGAKTFTPSLSSHPAWDEWIEICMELKPFDRYESHPAWDEWIEIFQAPGASKEARSLIPLGMSGLKFLNLPLKAKYETVSSRLG